MSKDLFQHKQIILNIYDPVAGMDYLDHSFLTPILLLHLQHTYENKPYTRIELNDLKKDGFEFTDQKEFTYSCRLKGENITFGGIVEEIGEQYKLSGFNEVSGELENKADSYQSDEIEEEKKDVQDQEPDYSNYQEQYETSQTQQFERRQGSAHDQNTVYVPNNQDMRSPEQEKAEKLACKTLESCLKQKEKFCTMLQIGNTRITKNTFTIHHNGINKYSSDDGIYLESNRYFVKLKNKNTEKFRNPLAAKLWIVIALNGLEFERNNDLETLHELDNMDEFYDAMLDRIRVFHFQDKLDAHAMGILETIDDTYVNELLEEFKTTKNMYAK